MHKNHYFKKSHKIQKLIIIYLFDFLFHIYLCTKTNTKYEMWSQNREKPIRIKQKTMNAKKNTPLYNNQINTQSQITPPHICKCINYVTRLNVYMYTHMYAHICKCLYASTYMYIHIRLRLTQLNSICTHYHPTIGHRETNHHLTSHCPTWNIPQLWTYKHTCTMLLQN